MKTNAQEKVLYESAMQEIVDKLVAEKNIVTLNYLLHGDSEPDENPSEEALTIIRAGIARL